MASDDGGATWNAPELAVAGRGTMIRHPPVARSDGQLLLPAYDERDTAWLPALRDLLASPGR